MMRHLLLILVLVCFGCAERLPRYAKLSELVSARLAPQQVCLRLPDDGEWTDVREDQVSLRGFPGPDGTVHYPDRRERREESIRAAYDLLTELGLYSVEEEILPEPGPGTMRHYRPTPLAQAHIRLVPGGHGESGWYGLCYGERKLVAIHRVGPVEYAPCRISREVEYSYRYAGIPAWADDPRLRRFFPDIIDSTRARTARGGYDTLRRGGDKWFVEEKVYGPYVIPCIDMEDGPFKTG
jgi:hypothetical protein